jgi:hypothetical protein
MSRYISFTKLKHLVFLNRGSISFLLHCSDLIQHCGAARSRHSAGLTRPSWILPSHGILQPEGAQDLQGRTKVWHMVSFTTTRCSSSFPLWRANLVPYDPHAPATGSVPGWLVKSSNRAATRNPTADLPRGTNAGDGMATALRHRA